VKIGIYGLGYVGLTTAACLLEKHLQVEGYEISEAKRALLAQGICPLQEPGVEPVLLRGLATAEFTVREGPEGGNAPDIIFICVGTPSLEGGATDLRAVVRVFESLDTLTAADVSFRPEVVLRSTVPPGTLEQLGRQFPDLYGRVPVLFYPEFLREGTAMKDFHAPPQTVLGRPSSSRTAERIFFLLKELGLDHEVVDAATAETVKLASNVFHAMKVCFANEMGRLASVTGGDARQVMRLFCKDTQLNISEKYLKPGNPYGGSCLPKDTRSLAHLGGRFGLGLHLAEACEASNRAHFDHIIRLIEERQPRTVTLLGLSFKKDTDDIRESPSLEIFHRLALRQACTIRIHDFLVRKEVALGANGLLLSRLNIEPDFHFYESLSEALEGTDLAVIMHADARYCSAVQAAKVPSIDVAEWNTVSL
jgi:GDP-mannose 6-dehydrogenase